MLVSCGAAAAAGGCEQQQAADGACGSRRDEVIGRVEAREGIPGGNEGLWRCGVARDGGITVKKKRPKRRQKKKPA